MQPPEQGSCLPLDRDAWCQNGGGSGSGGGSGWLWWVRRCWNFFHVGVKVWTSQGVMRSHSSRVWRGGVVWGGEVGGPGADGGWGGGGGGAGVVVVGGGLLEFFPGGGEGVDGPGGDGVALVGGVSGWAVAVCPGGGAGFELGVGGGGGVGDGFFDGVEEAGGFHLVVSPAEGVEVGDFGCAAGFGVGVVVFLDVVDLAGPGGGSGAAGVEIGRAHV